MQRSVQSSRRAPTALPYPEKNAQHHYLFLTFHHCIVDGWTANLLVDELSRDYCSDEEHRPQYDDSHAFSASLKILF